MLCYAFTAESVNQCYKKRDKFILPFDETIIKCKKFNYDDSHMLIRDFQKERSFRYCAFERDILCNEVQKKTVVKNETTKAVIN